MISNFLKNKKVFATFGIFAVLLLSPLSVLAESGSVSFDTSPASPQQKALPGPTLGSDAAGAVKTVASGVGGWLANGIAAAAGGIAFIIMTFAAVLLAIVGTLFNWIVVFTIFKFGTYFGNSPGLLLGWGILRDIGNILLLFAFVYLGIMIILDVHGYDVRKTLPRLLIVAVLLNFSLFAAEAVIDVSNVLSASLFANAGQAASNCAAGTSIQNCATTGISDQIIQTSGLSGIFPAVSKVGDLIKDPQHAAVVFIGLALFISIVCVVLLAACILLAIRAVVLMLVMVSAPIGFVAAAIPQTQQFSKRWVNMLLSQSFFAPVYLLLVYVGLKVVNGIQSTLGGNGTLYDSVFNGGANSQSYGVILVVFALVIGFMVAALVSAKNLGAMGAGFAVNTASRAVYGTITRATNATVGGGGYVLRNAIQSKYNPIRDSFISRAAVSAIARPLEKANIDQRYAVGGILKAAGATTGANVASHATFGDLQHAPQQVREVFDKSKKQYQDEISAKQLEDAAHHGDLGSASNEESRRYLSSLGTKDLLKLHTIQAGDEGITEFLTSQQIEDLLKSDDLPAATKEKIRNTRFNKLERDVLEAEQGTEAEKTAARKRIQALTVKDFEQLSLAKDHANLFRNTTLAANLTDDQAKKIKESEKILASQRTSLEEARNARFNSDNAKRTLENMSPEKVVELPTPILTLKSRDAAGEEHYHVIQNLSERQLESLDYKKLDSKVVAAIAEEKFGTFDRAKETLGKFRAKNVTKLPDSILEKKVGDSYVVVRAMSGEQLAQLDPRELDPQVLNAVKDVLRDPRNPSSERFHAVVGKLETRRNNAGQNENVYVDGTDIAAMGRWKSYLEPIAQAPNNPNNRGDDHEEHN